MKNKTFVFKYDPKLIYSRLWQGRLKSVEPHIIRSDSIKALLRGLTEERLELFSVLVKKKPNSLNELNRNYQTVREDAEILSSLRSDWIKGRKTNSNLRKNYFGIPGSCWGSSSEQKEKLNTILI